MPLFAWIMLAASAPNAVVPAEARSSLASSSTPRAISVVDAIEMTGVAGDAPAAYFSPDKSRFVVVLRKGNPERNVNEFSIYLFKSSEALASPRRDRLVTMASSSNEDAIRGLRWLDDETLAFIGENPRKPAQVYTFNVRTRKLARRTAHPTSIIAFAAAGDGGKILYLAAAPRRRIAAADRGREVVIRGQMLSTLLAADASYNTIDAFWTNELFLRNGTGPAARIPIPDPIFVAGSSDMHLSPDGRYCLIPTTIQQTPAWWRDYAPRDDAEKTQVHFLSGVNLRIGERSNSTALTLVDTDRGTSRIFLDTPMSGSVPVIWAADGRSVYVRGYLPLDIADPVERRARTGGKLNAELAVPGGAVLRKLTDDEWHAKAADSSQEPSVVVTLESDLNSPLRIYATERNSGRKALLMDPNPQFRNLRFGRVEGVKWDVGPGLTVKGALYFPPDYEASQKYPVVIQTHGFTDNRFSMDGMDEWSSAYAARPLAAQGFLVFQTYVIDEGFPLEHFNDDNRFGVTRLQAGWNFDVAATEAAVDYLESRGLIDPARVGITGFSRTVATVGYMLTHPKHQYAAAILANGFDAGYFGYLAFASAQNVWQDNETFGGNPPFGRGLQAWLKESPGFNLDKVTTPVRLLALGNESLMEQWEWFIGLREQDKPVDFILLPDGSHLLTKPHERWVAQQGMVDWFRFWLQGYEDPDSAKAEQYRRWEKLCDLQGEQNPDRPAFCVRSTVH